MKRIFLALLLFIAFGSTMQAQEVKIGYTNIELILAYMPEMKSVNQSLDTYQKKLGEQLAAKENYAQGKLQEFLTEKEKGTLTPDREEALQKELLQLDQDIQKAAADAEEKLLAKREQLLVPVLEKLQTNIDQVAKENGYDYILNQTTSSGVSTILFGPEEDDLTEKLMKRLGIQIQTANGQ